MELKCKFKQQNDVVNRGKFKSRKVWVMDDENADYPQTIEVEVTQDKVNLFKDCRYGQPLTVSLNLRGREWTNPHGERKVFNTLQCWKVTIDENKYVVEASTKELGNIEKKFKDEFFKQIEDNDLPF